MMKVWEHMVRAQEFGSTAECDNVIQKLSAAVPENISLAHTCPPARSVTSALLLMLACSSHVPAVALRNLFYDLTETIPERIVCIHGFSAGSYTGMLVWHCIHIHGHLLGLRLGETWLGAIAFPVRFFPPEEHGTRITFVQCANDTLCPVEKGMEEFKTVCANRQVRLLAITDTENVKLHGDYVGKSFHSYSHFLE